MFRSVVRIVVSVMAISVLESMALVVCHIVFTSTISLAQFRKKMSRESLDDKPFLPFSSTPTQNLEEERLVLENEADKAHKQSFCFFLFLAKTSGT